jgi:polysaccharide transporter, PST family
MSPWLHLIPPFLRRRLAARSYLQRVIGNAGWLLGERALRMVMGFLVGIWIARYLGVEQYGLLNYATAFVGILAFFGSPGLEPLAVRDMVREPDSRDSTLGTLLALRLAGGLGLVLLAAAAILLLRPGDGVAATLVILISLAQVLMAFDAIDCWFQARVTSRYAVIAKASAFLAATAARVVLILADAPLTAFAWAIFGEAVLFVLAMLAAYRLSGLAPGAWRASRARARSLVAEGWPLMLSAFFAAVYLRIDQVMLGDMSGFAEVGTYAVAIRLVEVLYVVPAVIAASVFPAILKSKELSRPLYDARIQSLYDAMLWMAVVLAIPLCILAPLIVHWLFGDAFAAAAPALAVLAWMPVLVFLNAARQKWLWAENALKAGLAVEAAACALNVVGNLLLIPRYGAVGAGIASLIAMTGATVIVAPFSSAIRQSLRMFLTAATAPVRVLRDGLSGRST